MDRVKESQILKRTKKDRAKERDTETESERKRQIVKQ